MEKLATFGGRLLKWPRSRSVQARRNGWELIGYAGNTAAPLNAETFRVTALRPDGGLTVAPIVERSADGEELGEPLQLSPAYLAADVTLAYASTVHAAEGRTVDTTHSVTGGGANLGALLVQLTRGREANTAWVITAGWPTTPRPGRRSTSPPAPRRRCSPR